MYVLYVQRQSLVPPIPMDGWMEKATEEKGRPGQDQAVQIVTAGESLSVQGKKKGGSLAILARGVVSCTRTKIGSCVLLVVCMVAEKDVRQALLCFTMLPSQSLVTSPVVQ